MTEMKEFIPFGRCKKCGYPLASEINMKGKTRIFCERCGWVKQK